jgi:hypothetical protein
VSAMEELLQVLQDGVIAVINGGLWCVYLISDHVTLLIGLACAVVIAVIFDRWVAQLAVTTPARQGPRSTPPRESPAIPADVDHVHRVAGRGECVSGPGTAVRSGHVGGNRGRRAPTADGARTGAGNVQEHHPDVRVRAAGLSLVCQRQHQRGSVTAGMGRHHRRRGRGAEYARAESKCGADHRHHRLDLVGTAGHRAVCVQAADGPPGIVGEPVAERGGDPAGHPDATELSE